MIIGRTGFKNSNFINTNLLSEYQNCVNDLNIDSSGNFIMSYNDDTTIDDVDTSLQLWLGEYDFDTTIGMPYELILGVNNVPSGFIETEINTAIFLPNEYMTTDQVNNYGVSKILNIDYSSNLVQRTGKAIINIELNNGTTTGVTI